MRAPLSRNTISVLAAALALWGCSKDSATASGAGGSATGGVDAAALGGTTSVVTSSAGGAGAGGTSLATGGNGGVSSTTSTSTSKDAGVTTGGSSGGTSAQAGSPSTSSSRSESSATGGSAIGGSSQTSGPGGARDAGLPDAVSMGGTGGKASSTGSTGGSSSSTGSTGTSGFTPCPGATQTLNVGSGQTYPTVQAAVNAVSSGNSKWVQINVKAGTYKEQVTINKPFVCLVGESATTTTISNTIDNNILTGGTVLVKANDFSAANIAFENTHGKGESGGQNQAVAVMCQGQRHQFRNCRFLSYQDTLYTNTGTQYFRDCFIQGSVDYIFGDATAVFEDCTMHNIAEGTAVTAPRTPQGTTYGFVFLGGSLTAASGVRSNKVNLGRPWGPTAAAAYLNVKMDAHITTEGWTTMSDNTLAQTRFSEYKSTGAGASTSSTTRSSRQLSDAQAANYTVAKVLGSWKPGYSE